MGVSENRGPEYVVPQIVGCFLYGPQNKVPLILGNSHVYPEYGDLNGFEDEGSPVSSICPSRASPNAPGEYPIVFS